MTDRTGTVVSSGGAPPLLTASGITKRFGATRALSDVDLVVAAGERVAIMGENGAGKSTLMKVLAGVHSPDAGSITLDGAPFAPRSPDDANRAGVSIVYQEPSGFPHLSVLENLWMGRQPTRRGRLDRGAMRDEASALLDRLGLPARLLGRKMGDLSLADQQQVLIARAISMRAKLLILDEPTSILTATEADRLFALVDQLAGEGTGICYITHRFDELERVADRFVVLRDGRNAGETHEADREALLAMMGSSGEIEVDRAGHLVAETSTTEAPTGGHGGGAVMLEAHGLTAHGAFAGVDLQVRAGWISGLYGLVGAGRTELAMALFGEHRIDAGEVTYRGVPYRPRSSRDALARGIAYLPEDRRTQGLLPHMTVGENLAAASLAVLTRFGVLSRAREAALVKRWSDDLAIKAQGSGAPITSLSGGNQQKVLLARLVATEPTVLMLDEPTRGIDVATKSEIHRRVRELAAAGAAVLVISSEMAEMLTLADDVTVLHEGRVTARLSGEQITEQAILRAATGVAA
ncbi:sugar ABC transporter ATP-binding protein [Blastococcus haudaquaticus]|uniref:Monosaccharide ABC transporter ATP-binding protein, CUT2 family n=1 Tax=Blastococcus haudaquaticus TaxID=1938745 RepID=A0A286H151_9ACTN|nr:sugar ABC transporter ATP-binding protein [Blastococcus haudaquaticus]SOE01497.1 monosaccharide ABC transporter ATP-binding protein, CUT2 family [Blastococcus haudaquaticus]